MSLIDVYANTLTSLTGNAFQAEVCARLQSVILGFQTIPSKPQGDAGHVGGLVITLESVAVSGESLAGKFRGELRFSNGLQVVSADNAFGKSLSVTTVAWCLGAEAVFGLPDNDPSCFPLAVRDEIDLGGLLPSPVLSSQCTIVLVKDGDERLMLTRAIKGDCSRISAEELSADGTVRKSAFSARYHSMSDATGGFQHFFFEWLGLPHQKTVTYKGAETEIYLENLLPLFYIDQDEGWTDIQALQVTRYGQQQIGEFAVEYLLGGMDATAARLEQLRSAQTTAALKEKIRLLADRIVVGLNGYGWRVDLSSFGSVTDLVERWNALSLAQLLFEKFDRRSSEADHRTSCSCRAVAQGTDAPRSISSAPWSSTKSRRRSSTSSSAR